MARLPGVEPDGVEGAPMPAIAPTPTDFGLRQVGQDLQGTVALAQRQQMMQIRAQATADRAAVAPDLVKLQEQTGAQLAADAPNWNGTPGLASDQMAKASKIAADMAGNPNYTPGQRAEFQRGAAAHVAQFGDQVVDYENRFHQQQAVDQQEIGLNGTKTDFITDFGAKRQGLLDNYDGSQPGLTQNMLAAFDASSKTAIANAPAQLQPRLEAELAQMRTQTAAETVATEAHAQNTYVVTNGTNQVNTLINSISDNPLNYADVVAHGIPGILATMPASEAVKKDLAVHWQATAAATRIQALIQRGQPAQAQTELNDGRYDAVLTPELKTELERAADAGIRDHAPKSLDQALAQGQLRRDADAETLALTTTGKSTGRVDLDQVVAQLGPEAGARYAEDWSNARHTFATVGGVRDMPTPQLAAQSAAAPPDPADPDYASKIVQWQVGKQAAELELKARQDPGAWAFAASGKPAVKGPGAAAAPFDRGAMLQSTWTDVQNGVPHAGAHLAGWSIGTQFGAGIPANSWQIVPQSEASRLAATVIQAQPEQRLAAMQSLARIVQALPADMKLPNGTTAQPQAIFTKQLLAAHLSPQEVSAVVDFGTDPAKLGRYVAAINNPTLAKPEGGPAGKQLTAFVNTALAPYLQTAQPMPGNEALAQARVDRTVTIARELIASQHMSPQAAAQTAAGDMTAGYRYVDTWRMPAAQAGGWTMTPYGVQDGAGQARIGAGRALSALTANKGANLYAPSSLPGNPDQQRALYAAQVSHSARWVTTPDDGGLMLMVPHPDGTFDPVADRFGRPVRASWSDLQGQAKGTGGPMFQAPANAVHGPDGQPLPATSKAAAFSAISGAVVGQESGGRTGLVSSAGALGRWQVMPDTVSTYAPRLGLPVDLQRAQHDDDYNQRIGQAALSDNLNHYGTGAGIGLALAAYNAGRGRLEGFTDKGGQYHPGWLTTIGDPRTGHISLTDFVSRIPVKETRDYVQSVLPSALRRLHEGG